VGAGSLTVAGDGEAGKLEVGLAAAGVGEGRGMLRGSKSSLIVPAGKIAWGVAGALVGVGTAEVGLGENLVVAGAAVTGEVRSMVVDPAVVTEKGAALLTWSG